MSHLIQIYTICLPVFEFWIWYSLENQFSKKITDVNFIVCISALTGLTQRHLKSQLQLNGLFLKSIVLFMQQFSRFRIVQIPLVATLTSHKKKWLIIIPRPRLTHTCAHACIYARVRTHVENCLVATGVFYFTILSHNFARLLGIWLRNISAQSCPVFSCPGGAVLLF